MRGSNYEATAGTSHPEGSVWSFCPSTPLRWSGRGLGSTVAEGHILAEKVRFEGKTKGQDCFTLYLVIYTAAGLVD